MKTQKLVYDAKTKQTRYEEFEYEPVNPRIYEIEDRLRNIQMELQSSDYKAIKYAEGLYSKEEYAPIKAQREALRKEYNDLEAEYEQAKANE